MLPVLGSSTVGLVDLFLKFSSVAVRKRSAPFYKYSFWSFLCNPPVLPSFPCLGMLGFFFHLPFSILRTHGPDSLCWFPSLCIVQVLQSSGLSGPQGMLPCVGSCAASASGINSSCANSSPHAGTGSDWETHRSRTECSRFLTCTSRGLKWAGIS